MSLGTLRSSALSPRLSTWKTDDVAINHLKPWKNEVLDYNLIIPIFPSPTVTEHGQTRVIVSSSETKRHLCLNNLKISPEDWLIFLEEGLITSY